MTMPLTYFDISATWGHAGVLAWELYWRVLVDHGPGTLALHSILRADLYLEMHKGFGMVTYVLAICFGLGFLDINMHICGLIIGVQMGIVF